MLSLRAGEIMWWFLREAHDPLCQQAPFSRIPSSEPPQERSVSSRPCSSLFFLVCLFFYFVGCFLFFVFFYVCPVRVFSFDSFVFFPSFEISSKKISGFWGGACGIYGFV